MSIEMRGNNVTLFEHRPVFRMPDTWTNGKVAQFRYDPTSERWTLYWSDRGDNTISRAPMDPETGFSPATRLDREVLVRGLKEAIGVALDLPRGRMAYTSLGGEVGVAKLDGSGGRMLQTAGGMLTGICWSA